MNARKVFIKSNQNENRRNYGRAGGDYNSYQSRNDYAYDERTNNHFYQDRSKYTWTKQNATGANTNDNNYDRNYSNTRYHVDNRSHNRTEEKSASLSQLSANDVLDLIAYEMNQLEKRHVWLLTVVSPYKSLGNVPGLEDVSPEEIRYQYYQSLKDESLTQFLHEYDAALKKVAEYCRVFQSKSGEAIELVKKMLRADTNDNEMTTDSTPTNAMSSFSFNLNALPSAKSTTATAEFPRPDQNQSAFTSIFDNTASVVSNFSFNIPSTNNVPSQPFMFNSAPAASFPTAVSSSPQQSQTNMNSFSFDLNNLRNAAGSGGAVNNLAPFAPNHNVHQSDVDASEYSNMEQLSSEILEAFRAKTFKFGHVPLTPPPKELCSI